MENILDNLKKHKKITLLLAAVIIGLLLLVIYLSTTGQQASPGLKEEKSFIDIEREGHTIEGTTPDIRSKRLPDGRTVEYGSKQGPLTPEMEKDLEEIIQSLSQKKKQSFLRFSAYAADPVESIPIEVSAGANTALPQSVRAIFRQRQFFWTDRDVQSLQKIRIAPNMLNGVAYGLYGFVAVKTNDGTLTDWLGTIEIWDGAPFAETVIHEYGHHYTNFWSAIRTQSDTFARFPTTDAGDYYQLRPLPNACFCPNPSACACTGSNCAYHLIQEEIIAEDYKILADGYTFGHFSENEMCTDGSKKVGLPDRAKVKPYLASLALVSGATPTPYPTVALQLTLTLPTPIPETIPVTDKLECFLKGGLCTSASDCSKTRDTVFEETSPSCTTPKGCCIVPQKEQEQVELTACEKKGNLCTTQALCQTEGETQPAKDGCGGVCCKINSLPSSFTNRDYNNIIARIRFNTINPLVISAWLTKACRSPGIQIVSCNPKNGDCNRVRCLH